MGESDYRREQAELYPPDGYFSTTSKQKKENGKRGKVTRDNREYPQAYCEDYKEYDDAKKTAIGANGEYRSQKDRYQEIERKTFIPSLYDSHIGNDDRSGIYYPQHHRALREPSDRREDTAYE